jgi:hypothetical protein
VARGDGGLAGPLRAAPREIGNAGARLRGPGWGVDDGGQAPGAPGDRRPRRDRPLLGRRSGGSTTRSRVWARNPAIPVARSTAPRSTAHSRTESATRSSGSRRIRAGTALRRTCSCFPWGSSSAGSSPVQLRPSSRGPSPVASSSTATAAERATHRPRGRPSTRCAKPLRSRVSRICASPGSMAPAFGSERGTGPSTSHSSRGRRLSSACKLRGGTGEPEGFQRAGSLIRPLIDVDGTQRR